MALQLDDFTTRWARAVAAAGLLIAGAAATAQTTFTDRASWEAAAGSFQTETFNAFGPGPNAPLGVFHVGLLTIETAEDSPSAQGFLRIEDGGGPNNVDGTVHLDFEVDGSPKSTVTLIFDPPVRAWGADLLAPLLGNPIDIELDGMFWQQPAQTGTPGFLGFISETPVARVTFRDRFTSTSRLGLDNVSFGDVAFLVSNLSDGPVAAAGDLPGSLRQAIFDAEANFGADTIVFDPALSGVITLTEGQIRVQGALSVQGLGADTITVSGGDATRLFEVGGPGANTYTFAGLALADGNSGPSFSGAIDMFDGDGTLRILDCVVRNNRNQNNSGTAISVIAGSFEMVNSAVINNSGGQGVIYLESCDALISNSTFSGNAGAAGDIWVRGFNGDASVRLEYCTFSGFSGGFGAITYLADQASSSTLIRYTSCIFAGDDACFSEIASDGVNTLESLGYNIVLDATSDAFAAASDLTTTDPLLAPLEPVAGTFVHVPLAASPARNAGDPALTMNSPDVPEFDQRGPGSARILEGRIDIGAIESIPTTACGPADVTTNGNSNGVPDGLVTLSDFSFYLSLWSQSDPAADVTTEGTGNGVPDGTVTLSDFSYYLSLWSQGCP